MTSNTSLLVALWIAFFILHSILASHTAKEWFHRRWPSFYARYRLLYNVAAGLTVLPALAMALLSPSAPLWEWRGAWEILYWLLTAATLAIASISSRQYDLKVFLGLSGQPPGPIQSADEPFALSQVHRFVRHPWYFTGLILIWIQDMNFNWFVSCVLMTVYFWYGSRLEENKLVDYYGEPYRRYQEKVAGLFPVPWKVLSKPEADALQTRTSIPQSNLNEPMP